MKRLFLLVLGIFLIPQINYAQQRLVVEQGKLTLAEAVEQVPAGGTSLIKPGFYTPGRIKKKKKLTLRGEGEAILDGESENQILTITADSVLITGLTFQNTGISFMEDRAAVKVDDAHAVRIENNHFRDNFFAIYLAKSGYSIVKGNTIEASKLRETRSGNGIHLWYCKGITIENNRVTGHRDGIYMEFVEEALIENNWSESNLRYGLHFMFSDKCTYQNNVFINNDAGVAVMYTKNVTMIGNRFVKNWGSASYGILLKDITDSVIHHNIFSENSIGLYAEGSDRIEIYDNDFIQNGWAVKIMANALDNNFRNNNFIANSFDVTTNGRQNNSYFKNNYWSNYEGYDVNHDGFGDVPFRPVRLFSMMVQKNEPALILLRSFFVSLLDTAERIMPALTPETLVDEAPLMQIKPFLAIDADGFIIDIKNR